MNKRIFVLFFLLIITFGGQTMAAESVDRKGLTASQEKLAKQVLDRLTEVYKKELRVASPMTEAELDALTVPSDATGKTMGPLPWDLRLLLSFDKNLVIGWDTDPLFEFITKDRKYMSFGPTEFVQMMDELGISPEADRPKGATAAAEKIYYEHTKTLPPLISLRQIGGDEIPYLWPSKDAEDCSSVVHFDYDDIPMFYLRNTCLLDYVMQYITKESGREAMSKHGTGYTEKLEIDYSLLFTPEEDTLRYNVRKDDIKRLNQGLDEALLLLWGE